MLAIAILAAGKGTRMKSKHPKVLQRLGGKSLIERVLYSCQRLKADQIFVIVGHQAEKVKNELKNFSEIIFINQIPQNGTGHAVQQLLPMLDSFKGDLLVLNGDVPLLKQQTIESLVLQHRKKKADVTFLSSRLSNPKGYGRVFSGSDGVVERIKEDRDCSEKEKQNTLTNAGIYCFAWEKLKVVLPELSNKNEQKETYLTDTISRLAYAIHLEVDDAREVSGVNDKIQLSNCEEILQDRLRNFWMKEGVTFINPQSCSLSDECSFGKDIIVEPQTHIRGKCIIGDNCHLGPSTYIKDSTLGENTKVIYSVLNNCTVQDNVTIGPFSHIRPQATISNNCKIGNFVEIKNSRIGGSTKISHLTYIGDSDIGNSVNIGAGTITANYDGVTKNKTIIGNNTKTGANSVLVAPVKLGENVTVGAGSTITADIPDGALGLERSEQLIKKDWSSALNISKRSSKERY